MGVIDRIEEKAVKYLESGLECPDFVYLGAAAYSMLKREMSIGGMARTHPIGHVNMSVYTSVAYLHVQYSSVISADSIIIGDHAIITMLGKLGVNH